MYFLRWDSTLKRLELRGRNCNIRIALETVKCFSALKFNSKSEMKVRLCVDVSLVPFAGLKVPPQFDQFRLKKVTCSRGETFFTYPVIERIFLKVICSGDGDDHAIHFFLLQTLALSTANIHTVIYFNFHITFSCGDAPNHALCSL